MELFAVGIINKVYNFGQPRVGDIKYASFVNTIIKDYWRFTHDKDLVPHIPPIDKLEYYHSCGEIFENFYGSLQTCIECEDPLCADQYLVKETNIDDHRIYLGHELDCSASTK